jgi:hypothetical protein
MAEKFNMKDDIVQKIKKIIIAQPLNKIFSFFEML